MVIGLILVIALIAFEIFNFDTTQYALADLLGDVSFAGLRWATILAVAFCFIDFAGLAHLFSPDRAREGTAESWYLMGAWLLGATMNALMTWWAVSLTLLSHEFGNEVLSRQQLLHIVPIFVAVLVWLTRILFIGAFSVAGDHLFSSSSDRAGQAKRKSLSVPAVEASLDGVSGRAVPTGEAAIAPTTDYPLQSGSQESQRARVGQRPPGPRSRQPVPLSAAAARSRR